MRHSFFEIRNFKGIVHVSLDLNDRPRSTVYTLVGLNESGKTTILEAIDFLRTDSAGNVKKIKLPELPGYSSKDPQDLIPMAQRDNFNGDIEIEAGFQLESEDKEKLRAFLEEHMMELVEEIDDLTVSNRYAFKDSELQPSKFSTYWGFNPIVRRFTISKQGKRVKARKTEKLSSKEEGLQEWHSLVQFMRTLLPSVIYFPNFLFDFPNKIYLEESSTFSADDQEKHHTYRAILQDVLDAMGGNRNLSKHILDRAKNDDKHQKQALEAVLLKMGSEITGKVFENWNRIFDRNIGNKHIEVRCDNDEVGWYLQLRLRDGTNIYEISERSLGFRWFFAFILLTQYRGFRKDAPNNVLFLLDEPASNLHPSAQHQLLGSFGKMPNCAIIYTTHSYHLINPSWLESTFVVKNAGLDYDSDESYDSRDTNIMLERYRSFAAKHPDQTTYFQPILDVLDYHLSELENIPNVVMLEGKNDFYTLKYIQRILDTNSKLNLMPGGGASSLDDVIRLYIGWGRNFIVLLDSDKEGRTQKKRYEDIFGLIVKGRIFCLEDIDPSWNVSMERLFSEDELLKIQKSIYQDTTKFAKTEFNRAVQELSLTDERIGLSNETAMKFKTLLAFCAANLSIEIK